MGKKRLILVLFAILAIASFSASAAVIHGKVYDLNLDESPNAIVEISTEPAQKYVAKNSTYAFNVQPGDYTISAKMIVQNEVISFAEENLTVKGEGDFVVDLILFPSFEEEEQILADSDFEIEAGILEEKTSTGWIIAVLIAIAAFFVIIRMKGKEIMQARKNIEDEGNQEEVLENVVDFIKKEGGRATQKEIRKEFPQSEAKISLMLTELEEKGKIRKIKKGRGNIIILNK